MLYQIQNGTVSLDGEVILDHIDFYIKGTEKAALVGRNGAGKTTLLRLLAGELELDVDDKRQEPGIRCARSISVGVLEQNPLIGVDVTFGKWLQNRMEHGLKTSDSEQLTELTMSSDLDVRLRRMMTGLGFRVEDRERTMDSFSGGERTKLMLISLLIDQPELLLLDEPTNHLDVETVEWLEKELRDYPGAVLLISHDRFFVDRVANVVWEVQEKKLNRYPGGYTDYRKAKLENLARTLRKYEEQQAELKRLNELIERFKHKPNKAAFARSRKKMIERMELIEKPVPDEAYLFTGKMEPAFPGSKWVLETDHLEIGYEQTLLEMNLRIRRGQKIGIIGPNGSGKTTFLKTIMGQVPAIKGKYSIGNNVKIGYFDQLTGEKLAAEKTGAANGSAELCAHENDSDSRDHSGKNDTPTVYEHFHDHFPGLLQQDARKILGHYLFSGRITATPVTDLSGGEKARLSLCELLTECPNCLVLDEPTNHMDIPAKETLESAFRAYTGTILFVSHDRYFIDQVADALLIFEHGEAYYYPFGYRHYLERKRRLAAGEGDPSTMAALVQAENAALAEGMRAVPKREHHEARQMTSDEAHKDWQLRLSEDPMENARARVEELNEQLSRAASLEEYEEIRRKLDEASEEWTKLCSDWYDVWES